MKENNFNSKSDLLDLLDTVSQSFSALGDDEREHADFFTHLDNFQPLRLLADVFKVNPRQAALLTILYTSSVQGRDSGVVALCKQFGCTVIQFMKMRHDLKELCDRRIVFRERNDYHGHPSYMLPVWVIDKISDGEIDESGLTNPVSSSMTDLCDTIGHILHERRERFITAEQSCESLRDLQTLFPENTFVKRAKELDLNDNELLLYYLVFENFINNERDTDLQQSLTQLLNKVEDRMRVRKMIAEENSVLFSKRVLELAEGNFRSGRLIRFTDNFRSLYLHEFVEGKISTSFNPRFSVKIACESVTAKKLFFTPDIETNRNRIQEMIKNDQLPKVFGRLQEKGMSRGVTVLLHGYPGTGKTELVHQLALESGRDIFQVDISSIRDKWVGESEKRLKGVYEEYKKAVSVTGKHPILLFNESDALISKRMNVSTSVDQMENTMQNILLQEMENFEGIFVATTNMTGNLDKAFERRFLIKIKFEKPLVAQRALMWRSKISWLTEKESEELAEQFEFSGGQIDNVVKRLLMEEVVSGGQPAYQLVVQFSNEEILDRRDQNSKIGF
jgi:hypothetical protein